MTDREDTEGDVLFKVLVVEDDPDSRHISQKFLADHNIGVDAVSSAEEARDYICSHKYDTILLDLMLPGDDGFTFLRWLRGNNNHTPVIIASALTDDENVMNGFSLKADDYMTKPFSCEEMINRVLSQIRRKMGFGSNHIELGGNLVLDIKDQILYYGDKEVNIRSKSLEILAYIAKEKKLVSFNEILDAIYQDGDVSENLVYKHISQIRSKLKKINPKTEYIVTEHGKGWKWNQ